MCRARPAGVFPATSHGVKRCRYACRNNGCLPRGCVQQLSATVQVDNFGTIPLHILGYVRTTLVQRHQRHLYNYPAVAEPPHLTSPPHPSLPTGDGYTGGKKRRDSTHGDGARRGRGHVPIRVGRVSAVRGRSHRQELVLEGERRWALNLPLLRQDLVEVSRS